MMSSIARSSPLRAAAIRDNSVGSRQTRRWSCSAALDLDTHYLRGNGKAGVSTSIRLTFNFSFRDGGTLAQVPLVSNRAPRAPSLAAAHALERLPNGRVERVAEQPAA